MSVALMLLDSMCFAFRIVFRMDGDDQRNLNASYQTCNARLARTHLIITYNRRWRSTTGSTSSWCGAIRRRQRRRRRRVWRLSGWHCSVRPGCLRCCVPCGTVASHVCVTTASSTLRYVGAWVGAQAATCVGSISHGQQPPKRHQHAGKAHSMDHIF
jgi:hypothetical protein